MRLDDDDHVQRWCDRLVPPLGWVDAGLEVSLHGRGVERLLRQAAGIQLPASLALGAHTSIRAVVGPGQRRVCAPRGDAGHMARLRGAPGVVMAQVTSQHPVGHRDHLGAPVQQGVDQAVDPSPRRRPRHCGRGVVLTALWTPTATRCRGRWWRRGARCRLAGSVLGCAAHDRLEANRARAPCLDTDPREGPAGQSGPWLAVQTGTEPLQAVGGLAGCGDPHFLARQEVERIGTGHMLTAEAPPPPRPWHGLGEQARHGAIAAPWAGPAGKAPPGEACGHDQQGACDPTAVAEGRRRDMGSETWEPCSNVQTGLLPSLSVAVVVDDNSSIGLRQKPFHVHAF